MPRTLSFQFCLCAVFTFTRHVKQKDARICATESYATYIIEITIRGILHNQATLSCTCIVSHTWDTWYYDEIDTGHPCQHLYDDNEMLTKLFHLIPPLGLSNFFAIFPSIIIFLYPLLLPSLILIPLPLVCCCCIPSLFFWKDWHIVPGSSIVTLVQSSWISFTSR